MQNSRLNLVFIFLALSCLTAYAQNKTLGVGVATPNPNAALHVESPTNNQGMIMPRLTTVQRTGMTLGAGDNGLMVYDTDLKANYLWNGTAWSKAGLSLPANVILNTADLAGVTDALAITYNGDDTRSLLYLDFANAANANIVNPFVLTHRGQGAAMTLTQSGTLGTGGIFQLTNAANTQQAFRATTIGTGNAGRFVVNNAPSGGTALVGTTNSDLGGVLPPVGVYGEATGTGASAGSFRINNASNPFSALFAETNGTGIAVNANILNAASSSPVIYANHAGNGFGVHAVANTTAFGGSAVYGEQLGTGDASGAFRINNAANNFSALYGETNGTGAGSSAVRGLNTGGGNGAYFRKDGATASTAAMWADNFGTDGYGAIIQNVDASNPTAALFAEAVGAGPSIWANKDAGESGAAIQALHGGTAGNAIDAINNGPGYAIYARAVGATDAIYAVKEAGDGAGSAGNFWNNEPSNGGAALFAASNAAVGSAIGALNSAEGNAVSVFQGGFKMSTHQASGGGAIAIRAMAYTVDANSFTFSFPISEGESFYVFNIGGASATVEGATIPAAEGRVFIMIGGVLRPF
ncbi:MAG: hypothetical protein KDC93_13035 [Cyclobacteriaceae bacterium]|nr:hypothetical protein [Cyclobacteriaceae bacterium]